MVNNHQLHPLLLHGWHWPRLMSSNRGAVLSPVSSYPGWCTTNQPSKQTSNQLINQSTNLKHPKTKPNKPKPNLELPPTDGFRLLGFHLAPASSTRLAQRLAESYPRRQLGIADFFWSQVVNPPGTQGEPMVGQVRLVLCCFMKQLNGSAMFINHLSNY